MGLQYAIGPEHTALMGYDELNEYILPRFNVISWQGFNSSILRELDAHVTDSNFAKSWASSSHNNPSDACGFVVMAQVKFGYQPVRYCRNEYRFGNHNVDTTGNWTEMPLHQGLSAWMGKTGSELTINFISNQLILLMWIHDWSGIASIVLDGNESLVDLYCNSGGFKRLIFKNLNSSENHKLTIKATGKKNSLSKDDQILFFSAASYTEVN
jgi:hypothetical protein